MKIICIGRNYANHIEELKNERPTEPVVFMKPDSAILLKQHPFVIPEFSEDIHHEIELIVKISKVGKYIEPKFAHKYYDEISVGIDFTARDLQSKLKAKGLPWELAKGFDGSAVLSDFYPKSEFNLSHLHFTLNKNGKMVQNGNTQDMIFSPEKIISFVSAYFTLRVGDLIFTGTPKGVGKVEENDCLEAFLEDHKLLSLRIM